MEGHKVIAKAAKEDKDEGWILKEGPEGRRYMVFGVNGVLLFYGEVKTEAFSGVWLRGLVEGRWVYILVCVAKVRWHESVVESVICLYVVWREACRRGRRLFFGEKAKVVKSLCNINFLVHVLVAKGRRNLLFYLFGVKDVDYFSGNDVIV